MTKAYTLFFTALILAIVMASSPFAQQSQQTDVWLLSTEIFAEGTKLATKKKFKEAKSQFDQLSGFWQNNHYTTLYLKIIAQAQKEEIKENLAKDIFRAVEKAQQDKLKDALKRIDKVIKKNKAYFPARIVRADILSSFDSNEEAEEEFSRAIEIAENNLLPLIFRAKFYAKSDRPDLSIKDLNHAIAIDSTNAPALFERGYLFCIQRDYDKAIADFSVATAFHPQWTNSKIVLEAYYNRGAERVSRNDNRGAVEDFTRAIEIDPAYLNSYLSRGMAYMNLKSYSNALEDFDHCINNDPRAVDALYNRATIHNKRRQYEKAIDDLNSALELRPGDKKLHFELGENYYYSGKYPNAIHQFEKVSELDPGDYWSHYRKGFAYKMYGQPRKAVEAFQDFLGLVPEQYRRQILSVKAEISRMQR